MKKIFLLFVMMCVTQITFAQLKVDATGNTLVDGNIYIGGASNFLATNSNTPIVFKVNNSVAAGSTGSYGNSNVSFGYGSLSNNTTGTTNTAIGSFALSSNTNGSNNTAIGTIALSSNTDGLHNTAIGYSALESNTNGSNNTAIGHGALKANTTGTHNTANGVSALRVNKTGSYNTAYGFSALESNSDGSRNTANGFGALSSNRGSYNTAYGYYALRTNSTGSYNTAIGYIARASSSDLNNATAIGYDAIATASNQVRIGNSSVTSIGGYAAWTNISDGRVKKNIRADVPGLNFINSLKPVTYNLDLDAMDKLLKPENLEINDSKDSLRVARSSEEKEFEAKSKAAKQKRVQTGFVAQDVEETAKSIGYDFSGVDVDEMGIYGLRYAEFVVPLVKAVQELSEKNDAKDAAIASLQELCEKNVTLQEQVNELSEKNGAKDAAIEALQKQVNELSEAMKAVRYVQELHSADGIGGENESKVGTAKSITEQAKLFQNTPNPFNQTTEIGYYIPKTTGSANIYIYDVNGVQQKNISIAERENGVTVLQATALQAGIYFYTLICDGKPVDTKQMILTR